MISKLHYSLLIVIVFFVLHISLVYDAADHTNHVPKKGSAAELDDHYDDDFCIILRSDIAIAYSNGGSQCPIDGVDVFNH